MPPLTTKIVPVSFFPSSASAIQFRGVSFSGRPSYLYTFGSITPGTAAIPAVGTQGQPGYVAAVPAIEESFVGLPAAVGNVDMTTAQFSAWSAGGTAASDDAYQIACLLTNLGLTAV
jgi:hypothetical protein